MSWVENFGKIYCSGGGGGNVYSGLESRFKYRLLDHRQSKADRKGFALISVRRKHLI